MHRYIFLLVAFSVASFGPAWSQNVSVQAPSNRDTVIENKSGRTVLLHVFNCGDVARLIARYEKKLGNGKTWRLSRSGACFHVNIWKVGTGFLGANVMWRTNQQIRGRTSIGGDGKTKVNIRTIGDYRVINKSGQRVKAFVFNEKDAARLIALQASEISNNPDPVQFNLNTNAVKHRVQIQTEDGDVLFDAVVPRRTTLVLKPEACPAGAMVLKDVDKDDPLEGEEYETFTLMSFNADLFPIGSGLVGKAGEADLNGVTLFQRYKSIREVMACYDWKAFQGVWRKLFVGDVHFVRIGRLMFRGKGVGTELGYHHGLAIGHTFEKHEFDDTPSDEIKFNSVGGGTWDATVEKGALSIDKLRQTVTPRSDGTNKVGYQWLFTLYSTDLQVDEADKGARGQIRLEQMCQLLGRDDCGSATNKEPYTGRYIIAGTFNMAIGSTEFDLVAKDKLKVHTPSNAPDEKRHYLLTGMTDDVEVLELVKGHIVYDDFKTSVSLDQNPAHSISSTPALFARIRVHYPIVEEEE